MVEVNFQARFQASPYTSGRVLGRSPPLVKWGGFRGTSPSRVGVLGFLTGGQNAPTILRGGVQNAPSGQSLCDVVHVGGVDGGGVEV